SHGVLVIKRARLRGSVLFEDVLHRDALARRRPHVRHVKVFRAVIIVINPADAHPRADIFNSRLRSNVSKSSIAIVTVEILAPEIIHHVKIRPAIAVEVVPPTTKAVARVVLVETGLGSYVAKGA